MAKSQRASSTKVNNAAFKKNIAGPIEKARAERLSAKLLELSQAPRASEQKKTEDATMDVSGMFLHCNVLRFKTDSDCRSACRCAAEECYEAHEANRG